MPNVITHGLMAQDVRSQLETPHVKQAIESYKRAYFLGCNGPDIFFYYNQWPWKDQIEAKRVHEIGNRIHQDSINAFYESWVWAINNETTAENKQILTAYLAGHLMHWSLDTIAHPYIFNQSGDMSGATKYWHYRFESAIDSKMVQEIKHLPLSSIHSSFFLHVSEKERALISRVYSTIVEETYEVYCPPFILEDTIKTGEQILRLMHDPKSWKVKVIGSLEKVVAEPWIFSSHVVFGEEEPYDVLNLKHRDWCHPADNTEISAESFVDLYDRSITRGIEVLEHLDGAINGQMDSYLDFIGEKSYDSGDNLHRPFIYYDSVYERGDFDGHH